MPESFDAIRSEYLEARCRTAVRALERRWFDARWFPGPEAAIEAVLEVIPSESRVGAGGSVTLRETGVLERLGERGDTVVVHEAGMEPSRSMAVRKDAITCPFFLCSSNAVTMEGELVNTDGIGNRLAGMMFGPETVIVLAGANKIVENREEAFSRIRNVAAPANALRLGLDVPCVKSGRCSDCASPLNICRITSIMSRKPMWTDVKVFLVARPLGL